jgi:predicted RNA-binding Zn-ribbon protein involved in translation (DUF1610 family)
MSGSPYTAADWAVICEQVNECEEPPIRRPRCSGLCYEVANIYHCPTCGEVPVARCVNCKGLGSPEWPCWYCGVGEGVA